MKRNMQNVEEWIQNIDDLFIEEAFPFEKLLSVEKKAGSIETRKNSFIHKKVIAVVVVGTLVAAGIVFAIFNHVLDLSKFNNDLKNTGNREKNAPTLQATNMASDEKQNNNSEESKGQSKYVKGNEALITEPDDSQVAKQTDVRQEELSYERMIEKEWYKFISEYLKTSYMYERGLLSETNRGETSTLYFYKGTNEIIIRVSKSVETEDYTERKVTAAEIKKYDICNYQPPYSQTIPKDLRVCMEAPIFSYEEFSQEVLSYRIIKHGESKDSKVKMRVGIDVGEYVIDYTYSGSDLNNPYELFSPNSME